jgi:hypothetical protein
LHTKLAPSAQQPSAFRLWPRTAIATLFVGAALLGGCQADSIVRAPFASPTSLRDASVTSAGALDSSIEDALTATQGLDNVLQFFSFTIDPKTFNVLQSDLDGTLAALTAGKRAPACSALQDFIGVANAQSGKKIPENQASALSTKATLIRGGILGC